MNTDLQSEIYNLLHATRLLADRLAVQGKDESALYVAYKAQEHAEHAVALMEAHFKS